MKNFFYFILFNVGCFAQQKEAIELYVSEKGTRLTLDYSNYEFNYTSHSNVIKIDILTFINPMQTQGKFSKVDDRLIQLKNVPSQRIKDSFKVSLNNKSEVTNDEIEVYLSVKKDFFDEYSDDWKKFNQHQKFKYVVVFCSSKPLVSDFDKAHDTGGCIVLKEGMNILSSITNSKLKGEFYLKVYPNFYNPTNRENNVYSTFILSPEFKLQKKIDIEIDIDPLLFCTTNFDGDYIRIISDSILEFKGEQLILDLDKGK